MKITLRTILPITAAGMITLTSCGNSVNGRVQDYAILRHKSYGQCHNILNSDSQSLTQARLDSMAFRDIFNSTEAAKDSNKVVQFETIAQNMQSTFNEIDRILTDSGISKDEYNFESFNLKPESDDNVKYQYFADNWMYRRFFEKNGIMNDSIKNICNLVSCIIRPQ